MNVIAAVVLGGWLVFWIYWLAAAADVKAGQGGGFRVAIVFVVLFLLVRLKLFNGHTVIDARWAKGLGLALFLLGVGLAVWARIFIGRNWGAPMSKKDDPDLVTTGPYRYVRHPIYSGIILGTIGTAFAVNLIWVLGAVVLGAYFTYSAVHEERFMAERFPGAYPAYKKSTKMLVPFIF